MSTTGRAGRQTATSIIFVPSVMNAEPNCNKLSICSNGLVFAKRAGLGAWNRNESTDVSCLATIRAALLLRKTPELFASSCPSLTFQPNQRRTDSTTKKIRKRSSRDSTLFHQTLSFLERRWTRAACVFPSLSKIFPSFQPRIPLTRTDGSTSTTFGSSLTRRLSRMVCWNSPTGQTCRACRPAPPVAASAADSRPDRPRCWRIPRGLAGQLLLEEPLG